MRAVLWLLVVSYLLFSLGLMAGCAGPDAKWYLANGNSVRSSPETMERAETDRAVCEAERSKIIATGVAVSAMARQDAGANVFYACMRSKGYILR